MTTIKKKTRHLRLLPGVMLICAVLIGLNGSGLVHQAFALDSAPKAPDATAPAPQSINQDFAGGDGQANAAEVDVLTSLSKRRATMDARQADMDTQANVLAATEARVDAKIAQLKDLQSQIAGLVAQRDAAQQKQVDALVKTYSAMKPASAAGIFNTLDESVLLPVAQTMKSDTLAAVLSAMNPDAARKLTMKLASKLALPETAAVMTPVAAAAPPPAAAPEAPVPATPAVKAPAKPAQKTAANIPAKPAPAPAAPAPAVPAPAAAPATPAAATGQ